MTEVVQPQIYPVVSYPPGIPAPVGQVPGHLAQGPAPQRPSGRWWTVVAAASGVLGLALGVAALAVAVSKPPPAETNQPTLTRAQPQMFDAVADKQWCSTMRPLLAERMDMTPADVIGNGPSGAEYRKFAAWVGGWSERMTTAMNHPERNDGWLDRSARRAVDMTVAVSFIKDDEWWTQDARYVFNDAAETSTTVNAYCRSLGEPVRP